jgi:hypothetical protein
MLLSTSIAAATFVLASGIEVRSSSECPSQEAIVAKLALLSSGGAQDDVAWVDVATPKLDGTTELRLRLLRPDASVVGERRLRLRGSCEDMADTVATVLAAWRTPPVSAPAQPEPTARHAMPAPAAASSALGLWLGAGGGMAWVGGSAATGNLELVAAKPASRVRARAAAFAQTSRELDLADGSVAWRRTHAELGLGWQSRGAANASYWQASADADVLLGWLRASGHGYYQDQKQDAFEYGVGAGLRGERKLGAWALWLEGRASWWARPQRVFLWESPSSTLLPHFDVLVSLGASRLLVR